MRLTPTFKNHRVAEPSRGITLRAEAASEVAGDALSRVAAKVGGYVRNSAQQDQ